MTEPRPPFMAEVPCVRVADGEPTTESLWVCFYPAFGPVPPRLTISQEWDGATHHRTRTYTVGAHGWAGPIFQVMLERSPAALEVLPPGADRQAAYTVSIRDRSSWCTCRGFILGDSRTCKHVAALAALVSAGQFPRDETNEQPATGPADSRGPRPGRPEN